MERRGIYRNTDYISPTRVDLAFELPLAEIVFDFYDKLKSCTKGYASFDYEYIGFKEGKCFFYAVLHQRPSGSRFPVCGGGDHPADTGFGVGKSWWDEPRVGHQGTAIPATEMPGYLVTVIRILVGTVLFYYEDFIAETKNGI